MASTTTVTTTLSVAPISVINARLFSLDEEKMRRLQPAPPTVANPKPDPNFLIYLGSTSPLKLRAVQGAFISVGAVCRGCDVKSGVSDQPCGQKETLAGAKNRANSARALHPEAKLWIGIENGMLPVSEMGLACKDVSSGWVDVAAIVVLSPEAGWVLWSDALAIPQAALQTCLDKQGRAVDVWSPLKDPHRNLTEGLRPRAHFLEAALRAWVTTDFKMLVRD